MGTCYDHLKETPDLKISDVQVNFLFVSMVVFYLKSKGLSNFHGKPVFYFTDF